MEMELSERMAKAETEIAQLKQQTSALQSLAESVAVLVNKTDDMGVKIDKVENSVNSLIDAPRQRWNTIIGTIITVITSGVVGFVLASLGL